VLAGWEVFLYISTFQIMFERKYQPEDIADHLHAIVRDGGPIFGDYERLVRPDDDERTRLLFTAQLFPIAMSFVCIAKTTKNSKLKEALLQAHAIYLSRFLDQDQIVRLGDYAIWRVEREGVSRVLREDFCQLVLAADFDNHEIRYGMLVRAVSDARKVTFQCDLERGLSSSQDFKQCFMFVFASAGVTFTRQVLKLDPNDPKLSSHQRERFQESAGFASTFIGQSYFKMTDIFKAMGA
jgi:hypothetical protein